MTPKERALEIYNKFFHIPLYVKTLKQCCYICVDEIIKSRKDDASFDDTLLSTSSEYYTPHPMHLTYWNLVKEEIEKL